MYIYLFIYISSTLFFVVVAVVFPLMKNCTFCPYFYIKLAIHYENGNPTGCSISKKVCFFFVFFCMARIKVRISANARSGVTTCFLRNV